MYHYLAYGLRVGSTLEIPEFQPIEPQATDVTICLSHVPPILAGENKRRANWQAHPGAILITDEGSARFLVEDGKRISIDIHPKAEPEKVRIYLLGSIFAALLQQRGYLTFHASSVATREGAALFVGSSGQGKSTLMSSLMKQGHAMVSDDVTAIAPDAAGRMVAISSFARMKLWQDSAEALGYEPGKHPKIRQGILKYSVPASNYLGRDLAVSRIFILSRKSSGSLTVEPLAAPEAFQALHRYTYRRNYMAGLGLQKMHFDYLTRIVQGTRVFKVSRPQAALSPDSLIDAATLGLSL